MKLTIGWRYRLMIAMLAVTAYFPTLKTGFIWDDHVMIEANPALRSNSWQNLKSDWTTDAFQGHGDPYYRPLPTFSFRLDQALWGGQAAGFHATNLLIHLGNALLTAELVLALGCLPLTAFLAGSFLAVHPIVVEQLIIVAGRAELMGLFFSLATLLLFLRREPWAWGVGMLAFLAALFSKESAVVTPLLLALVYYVRDEPRERYLRIIPLILIVLRYIALRQQIVGPMIVEPKYWLTVRFFVQEFPSVLWGYLTLIILPWNLHSHRLLPHIHPLWPFYLISLIGMAIYAIKRHERLAIFCIGWFMLCLLPKTPTMIYGNFMLDHWVYPSTLALFLPLAGLVTLGWTSKNNRLRSWTAATYFGVLMSWALLVHLNVALRGTDEKIYRWALRHTTSNPVKFNLGVHLLQSGRIQEAIEHFEDVRYHYPDDPRTAHALAMAYWRLGQRNLAIRQLEDFARRYPHIPLPNNALSEMKKELSKK